MMGFGFAPGVGGIVMILVMLVIVIVPIGLGVVLLAGLFPRIAGNGAMSGPVQRIEQMPTATEILKQRYVRGEITKEQYEQMRRDVEA